MAAQLLTGHGFDAVYNLKGGIQAWQGRKATGSVELNLDLITGEETPSQMIAIAYGLENALEKFYRTVMDRSPDGEVVTLLKTLEAVEERHKKMLRDHYQELSLADLEDLARSGDPALVIIEGGFRFTEFLKQNEDTLQTVTGLLDVAMVIETQALDLYLRFGHKMTSGPTRKILHQIAEEEKAHLSALGKLLEAKIG